MGSWWVWGPCADAPAHLFITTAFHQLDDVHMSIEQEDFTHKRACGRRTTATNQLIIITQTPTETRERERGDEDSQMDPLPSYELGTKHELKFTAHVQQDLKAQHSKVLYSR